MKNLNTKLRYYYQDWGGTTNEASQIFAGYDPKTIAELEASLKNGSFFIAKQVDLPELFFWKSDRTKDYAFDPREDHPWHAVEEIIPTEEAPTDPRSSEKIAQIFTSAHRNGWDTALSTAPIGQEFYYQEENDFS